MGSPYLRFDRREKALGLPHLEGKTGEERRKERPVQLAHRVPVVEHELLHAAQKSARGCAERYGNCRPEGFTGIGVWPVKARPVRERPDDKARAKYEEQSSRRQPEPPAHSRKLAPSTNDPKPGIAMFVVKQPQAVCGR